MFLKLPILIVPPSSASGRGPPGQGQGASSRRARRPAERLQRLAAVDLLAQHLVDDLESVTALHGGPPAGVEMAGHDVAGRRRRAGARPPHSGPSGGDSGPRSGSPAADRSGSAARPRAGAARRRSTASVADGGDGREQRLRVRVQRLRKSAAVGATSTSVPRYITATRWLTKRITPEVVRDEEVRQAQPLAQVDEQVQDLRAHRHVERRDGLVGDDEPRPDGQRAGDADALPLAAGQLVRVALGVLGLQPDHVEQGAHARRATRARGEPVHADRLADDAPDRHARVQRRVRVLEDDLRLAPERQQRAGRQRGDVLAVEDDASAGRLDGAQHEAAGRRLAAPALAHQPERLARLDREADAVDRAHERGVGANAGEQPCGSGKCLARSSTSSSGAIHAGPPRASDAAWLALPFPTRWQAATCPAPARHSVGTSAAQRGSANGQRGWKRQPEGSAVSPGITPGMAPSRAPSSSPGRQAISARVYGWAGA